ncbi:carbohydrate porin [Bradyrhizobium sp. 45]|uniref:carbohydrate porin n=1 Tax=Bradyrhizobium sp. 45 TaxID=1043587 RepID=UPI001FF8795E|nr:carbohydrate porin [Bradyrhizobium sp. 45]
MEEKTLGLLPIRFQNYGVNLAATYIGGVLGNASKGSKQGTIYEGRLNLAVDVDLQKLVGIDKLTFHANMAQITATGCRAPISKERASGTLRYLASMLPKGGDDGNGKT